MKYRLEDICIKITDGSHFSPKDEVNSSIPMLSVKDMNEFDFDYTKCKHISLEDYKKMIHQDCVPKKYDVLVAKDGSYLKEIFVNEEENDKALLSSIAIFRPNIKIVDPYFLCYLLKTPVIMKYTKENCVSGSALPRIILKAFKDIKLDIPEMVIQKKIVNIIKNINKKIILNNDINYNLQKFARAQFDKKFKNKDANAKFKDLVNLKKRTIKALNKNSKLGYYPIDTLPMNYLVTKDSKPNEEANSSLIEFSKYNILLGSMRVYFHRVCLAANDGITRNTTFVFEPKLNKQLYYTLLLIDRDEFIDYANRTSKGSTMPYAVWDALAEYDIYLPNEEETEKFYEVMYPIFEKMIFNEKQNHVLKQLRDTLLPKLMNGEIDLDKIEI